MKARRRHDDEEPGGYICADGPLCYALEMDYDLNSLLLTSIDLFDPNPADNGDVWTTIPPPWSAQATTAATTALQRAARSGVYNIDCPDDDCECRLGPQWGPWTKWKRMKISGRFSIPAPNPPPPKLRYRANGTIRVRGRWKIGLCYHIQVDS